MTEKETPGSLPTQSTNPWLPLIDESFQSWSQRIDLKVESVLHTPYTRFKWRYSEGDEMHEP